MAFDFDFGVIEKHLRLPGVQPPSRLGLLAGPVHKLRVDAVQVHHTLFGLGTQPFAQRGLIGAFNQAEQMHEHAVLPQALGIGQGCPATGKSEEQLGRVGHGRKSRTGALARVQRGRLVDAFPQTKAAAERIDQHLTAMRGRLVGVGQEEVQSGFLLREQRHGPTSP